MFFCFSKVWMDDVAFFLGNNMSSQEKENDGSEGMDIENRNEPGLYIAQIPSSEARKENVVIGVPEFQMQYLAKTDFEQNLITDAFETHWGNLCVCVFFRFW